VLVARRYSLLDTAAADGLFPACQRRGVPVLAAGVFNSGILADPRPGATYDYAPATAGLLDRAQRIRIVCERYGVPIAAAAIQFVLRHPAVTAVVVCACEATEVIEDVAYLTAAVPAELLAELGAGPVGDD
jgi:D-threo-aldose 1-dehydrogenase